MSAKGGLRAARAERAGWTRYAAARALAACLALLAVGLSACGSAQPSGASSPPPPLATALTGSEGEWALVPVVVSGEGAGGETFWELVRRESGLGRWSLVTPPGVQDNGGLALAGGGSALLAGFLPTHNLHFSPLALTHDGGRTWTPELLPSGLVRSPDSLALTGSGEAVALLTGQRGEAQLGGAGGSWSELISASALARTPAASSCGLQSIDAVSIDRSGALVVGGACSRPGVIGEYARGGKGWRAAGPPVPASLGAERAVVLRLTGIGGAAFTVIEFGSSGAKTLLAAWAVSGSRSWVESPPLPLGAGERLLSVGPGLAGGAYVLSEGSRGEVLRISAGSKRSWLSTPRPPDGSATVVLGAAGAVDVLAPHGSEITDWRLNRAAGRWQRTSALRVPL